MYTIKDCKLIKNISFRKQCQSDYFYGKDLILENFFGDIENKTEPIFQDIIKNQVINVKEVPLEYQKCSTVQDLKEFLKSKLDIINTTIETDAPIQDSVKNFIEEYLKELEDKFKNSTFFPLKLLYNPEILKIYTFTSYQAIRTEKILVQSNELINLYCNAEAIPDAKKNDLLYEELNKTTSLTREDFSKFLDSIIVKTDIQSLIKVLADKFMKNIMLSSVILLKNTTNQKFILSDSPVLHILKKNKDSQSYDRVYLLPISPELIICIYNEGSFFLNDKGKTFKEITDLSHIVALNGMQYINANNNFYFNKCVNQQQIKFIIEKYISIRTSYMYFKFLPEKEAYSLQKDFVFFIDDNEIKFNGKKICEDFLE